MKANIELQRPVINQAWCFHGEVGVPQKRPWAVAIAKLAASLERPIQIEDVSSHLLNDRMPMALGLVRQCCAWGLMASSGDQGWTLTDLGRQAAESNQVFIPETGTWIVWTCEDEIVRGKHPLLLLERWIDPDAFEETRSNRQGGYSRYFDPAPQWLNDLEGRRISFPLSQQHKEVHIFRISEQVEQRWDDHLSVYLHLECTPAGSNLFLAGNVKLRQPGGDKKQGPKYATREVKSAPWPISLSYSECWNDLMESKGLKQVWDDDRQSLRVPFPENDQERSERRATKTFDFPAIPDLGQFDAAQIKDIPLYPATKKDAQQWVEWSLLNKIDSYASTPRFDRWSKDATELFLDWQPDPPTRGHLVKMARETDGSAPSRRFWHLQAASDWNL